MIELERIDHFVMRVKDIEATCEFYTKVLGMEVVTFGREGIGQDGVVRKALRFGRCIGLAGDPGLSCLRCARLATGRTGQSWSIRGAGRRADPAGGPAVFRTAKSGGGDRLERIDRCNSSTIKINLHPDDTDWYNRRARDPRCGGEDFCLIAETPLDEVVAHLEACGVEIETPPSNRNGALGTIRSVYFRDPDGNLVEISNYL